MPRTIFGLMGLLTVLCLVLGISGLAYADGSATASATANGDTGEISGFAGVGGTSAEAYAEATSPIDSNNWHSEVGIPIFEASATATATATDDGYAEASSETLNSGSPITGTGADASATALACDEGTAIAESYSSNYGSSITGYGADTSVTALAGDEGTATAIATGNVKSSISAAVVNGSVGIDIEGSLGGSSGIGLFSASVDTDTVDVQASGILESSSSSSSGSWSNSMGQGGSASFSGSSSGGVSVSISRGD
jgi:hypothetical protein